ncbi:MAG: hypothetical protein M0Z45_11515 [Actinomycetota bacterium]|nr:hypothetical protein [Actinomycetota bacterium]
MKSSYMKRMALPMVLVGGSLVTASLYPSLASAQVPNLPSISASTLLTKVLGANAPIYSGTIQLVSNTGIPSAALSAAIPNSSSSLSTLAINALTGTTSYNYWVDGASNARVQVPLSNGELDLYASPTSSWLYDSTTNVATKVQSPTSSTSSGSTRTDSYTKSPSVTPATLVSTFLDKLPAGTTVSVATNAYIAGEPTYTLVISPNDPKSLITSITVSVDGNNFDPLGAAINTSSGQALSISYSQLSFTKPSESVFSFTPNSSMTQKVIALSGTSSTYSSSMATTSTSTQAGSSSVTHIGQGFSTITVHTATSAPSAQVQKELSMLGKFGTAATTSLGQGYVLSLSFGSIFIASNGSYAVGAVAPSTLLSAIA